MQNKFEILRTNTIEQVNQLKLELSNAQLNLRERNTNLKVVLEQADQLKQQIKTMEPEFNDAKITIIKLQGKINLQNIGASDKMNLKKNTLATKVVV